MAQPREKSRQGIDSANTPAALPAPRFAFGWASLVYALGTLSLGYPALLGKFLVSPHSDQYIAGYAFREFAASTLRTTGQFPLWNPYLFGGMPYIAAMHGDNLLPDFSASDGDAYRRCDDVGFIIHIFLAGLFTFGFLRAIGYSFYGSIIGGLAYMMSGQIASYVSPGHDGKLFVSALFPLALWILYRGIRGGKTWTWGAFALIIGLCVLSPHPQLLQYTLLACGAYALFLAFSTLDGIALSRAWRSNASPLLSSRSSSVWQLALSNICPCASTWRGRPGQGPRGLSHGNILRMESRRAPNVYCHSSRNAGLLGTQRHHLHSDYVGAVVLFSPAPHSLDFVGRAQKARQSGRVRSLYRCSGRSEARRRLHFRMRSSRARILPRPSDDLLVGTLAIALLACVGAERFCSGDSRRYLIGWLIAAGVIAILASVGALPTWRSPSSTSGS